MKILLNCVACEYQEWGASEKQLMNKIIIWNHVKKAHAPMAERIMQMYKTLPTGIYGTRSREAIA